MKASSLCFKAAILFVLVGMVWGMQMAISQDHSAFPAHAHLNLLGFVSLFLFGFYYRLHPALERSRLVLAQVWLWMVGVVIQAIGVALVHTGRPAGDPVAGIGSVLVVIALLIFAWLLFRTEASEHTVTQPAE